MTETAPGDLGPELYLVGKGVRRLSGPQVCDGHASLAFARRMLAEVMLCRPATQLALEFAGAQLEPLPPDGFVLSTFDVEAWLETQQGRFEPAGKSDSPR